MRNILFLLLLLNQYCSAQISNYFKLNFSPTSEISNSSLLSFKNQDLNEISIRISSEVKEEHRAYFSIYNPSTKWNDNYILDDARFGYNNSSYINENNFRTIKKDSFNPGGSSNLGSFVLNGISNLLLK